MTFENEPISNPVNVQSGCGNLIERCGGYDEVKATPAYAQEPC
jgi:hypothetical protein